MCNLYSQTRNVEAIRRLFKVGHNRSEPFEQLPAIFPGNTAPVIRLADDGERELAMLSWGFVLSQRGKAAKRVTNCRDDKVLSSPFWKSSFESRRCLVPVTSFSELKGRSPAVWHWFGLDDERSPFAFAGIWRQWKGKLKQDAEPIELTTYAFLTTDPNDVVKPVHPKRMPVMLVGETAQQTWLQGSADEAFELVKPYTAGPMKIVAKGDKRDDGAQIEHKLL